MADKPSRALVLYGDGLASFIDPSHAHLHALASLASCGFLALPNSPSSESEEERVVREFAVLLDSCEVYLDKTGDSNKGECPNNSLPERFMGMKAAILTNNASLKSFGAKLGLTVLQLDNLTKVYPVDSVASEMLKFLGFQDGKTQETSEFDLLFLHIGASEKAISNEIEYVNALIGDVLHLSGPGSEVGSNLHLSVVLSYGNASKDDESGLTYCITKEEEKDSNLSVLFPRQSYTMKGETPIKDVRHHSPMLVAQWQHAVTRKDLAEAFSFKDFKERGGNLVIPANRFLHELAFKLWKAPKYGA